MNELFTLIILGVLAYMLLFRRGAMGCCGGHHDQKSGGMPGKEATTDKHASDPSNEIIDLKKEDYKILS